MKNSGALPGTRLFCLQWKLSREWKGPFTKDLKIIVSRTGDVPLRSLWQAYEITRREKSDRGHIDRPEHGFWDSAGKLFLMGRRYIVRPPGYPDGLFVSQALRQSRGPDLPSAFQQKNCRFCNVRNIHKPRFPEAFPLFSLEKVKKSKKTYKNSIIWT